MLRSSQPPQVQAYEMVNVNNSQDKSESGNKPKHHSSTKAHQHPPKQAHQTPLLDCLSLVTNTSKKSKEGQRSKPDACLKDEGNTYQSLIQQQQPTDQDDYQSLTWHTRHKEYYNNIIIPPAVPPKPEAQSMKLGFPM